MRDWERQILLVDKHGFRRAGKWKLNHCDGVLKSLLRYLIKAMNVSPYTTICMTRSTLGSFVILSWNSSWKCVRVPVLFKVSSSSWTSSLLFSFHLTSWPTNTKHILFKGIFSIFVWHLTYCILPGKTSLTVPTMFEIIKTSILVFCLPQSFALLWNSLRENLLRPEMNALTSWSYSVKVPEMSFILVYLSRRRGSRGVAHVAISLRWSVK